MDNRQELLKKLHLLVQEIDKAKEMVDEEKSQYLNNYENRIEAVIKKLQDGTLPASKGGLIGTMRGISEYDSLASIKALYDAASDVDLFYSKECQKWYYINTKYFKNGEWASPCKNCKITFENVYMPKKGN